MKKRWKKISKSTISVLLSVIMVITMIAVGIVTVYAANGYVRDGYVYFIKPSTWSNVSILEQQENATHSVASNFTQLQDDLYFYGAWGMLDYMKSGDTPGIDYCFIDAAWGTNSTANQAAVDRRTSAAHYTAMLTYQFSTSGTYYLNIPASGDNGASVTQSYSTSDSGIKANQKAYAYYKPTLADTYSSGTTGGTVKVGGYYFTAYNALTTGETSAGDDKTYGCAIGTTATLTATPASGYQFDGWFSTATGDGEAVSNQPVFTYIVRSSSAQTYYARFSSTESTFDVDVTAGTGGTVDKDTVTVGTTTGASVTATPSTGYTFNEWEVTSPASVSDASSATTTVTASGDDGAINATFTEKARKTINVEVDGHSIVTVSGSSVEGENQTFTSNGTFQAHVDDVIAFTAAGRPSSDYSNDTLTYQIGSATPVSGSSFTVVSGENNYTITATAKEKSGYYFYVSASDGANATVSYSDSRANTVVSHGNREKIYVDSDAVTFTISASAETGYENAAIKKVTNSIADETPITIGSGDTQTKALANGATYYALASEQATLSGTYKIYISSAPTGGVSGDQFLYEYDDSSFNGKSGTIYARTFNLIAGDYWFRFVDDVRSYEYDSSQTNIDINNPNWVHAYGDNKSGVNDYKITVTEAGNYTFYMTDRTKDGDYYYWNVDVNKGSYEGGSGSDITSFDTYYLGGRFRIKDSDTGEIVYTDAAEGSWSDYSIKMPFTETATSNVYKLETNQTIAQLSALLNNKPPYFIIHDKSKIYANTDGDSEGLHFENFNSSSSALSIDEYSGSLSSPYEMLFDDAENNSDGMVVIYYNSDTGKIWYEVEDETAPVAASATLTTQVGGVDTFADIVGTEVTLVATVTSPHANAGTMTYTFYDRDGSTVIGTVSTTALTASVTVTDDTVRTDTYKVVVSSDGTDPVSGNKLRDNVAKTNFKYKNKTIYRTKVHLNNDTETLNNSSSWEATALTDEAINEFTVDPLAARTTFEFALSSAIPDGDLRTLQNNVVDQFYIDEKLSRYCDVTLHSISEEYTDGDNVERYSIWTYWITPRTNCSTANIHIDTNPLSVVQPDGTVKYYPGKIYAESVYTPTTSDTTSSEETVTYYFAEAVDDVDQSVTGAGMAIAYWNNSLHNVRTGTWADNIASLATCVPVSTPVNVSGSNSIFVDMTKLYAAKDTSTAKEFKIYSVDLPVWATSFAFMKANELSASNVIKTTSWKDGTEYDYSSILLNPNRVYLLYKNSSNWYSKGVVLDEKLWTNADDKKNNVGTKTFKSNAINYNGSYSGDSISNGFNGWLSDRAYSDYDINKALYFGYLSGAGTLTHFDLANNLAMRNSTAQDYHASIQDLVAEKLDTDNLNSNGFPLLETYTDSDKHNKVSMKLFDYEFLAADKARESNTLIKDQNLGVDFPMYESKFNGITTYSYDSSTDPNRLISDGNFVVENGYRLAAEYLGYSPYGDADKFGTATELDVEFFMTNTGSLKDSGGSAHDISFNFSGDDDVWVYVDGVLVLDLGGAHMASAGTINFTDMQVYYKTAADSSENTHDVYNDTWPHNASYVKTVDLQALLEANGVNFNNKDGSTKHTFQMFYLERGAHDSNMSVSFNLPQASGLNIKNEITANHVNDGLKSAALYAANKDYFTYGVSASLDDGTKYANTTAAYAGASNNSYASEAITAAPEPEYPANSDTNRVYSQDIVKGGAKNTYTTTYPLSRANDSHSTGAIYTETGSFTSLNNVTYNLSDTYLQPVNEDDTNLDLSGKTSASGELNLLGGQTATFDDKVTPHSFVKVYQKNDLGAVDTSTTPIGYETIEDNDTGNYYLTSYSIYDNASSSYIKEKTDSVVVGSSDLYAADDSSNTDMFYFSNYAKAANSAAMTVTFYNDIAVGDIKITKDYNSSADTVFYFKVEFTNIFGSSVSELITPQEYALLTYNVYDSSGRLVRRDAPYGNTGVAITKGQTAIISGVPVETGYRVTELNKNGTQLVDINKTIVGPDGNALVNATPTHGYQEHLDKTYINDYNTRSTSDRYWTDTTTGDKYYINMIPRVSESYISSTGKYKTTSNITFTNEKTSIRIIFNYYDRKLTSGSPATIDTSPQSYTVNGSLPDDLENDNEKIKEALSDLIQGAAVEYANHCASNVVDDYEIWTSLADAEAGIASKINIKTGARYDAAADFEDTKSYHTDSLSQPLGSSLRSNSAKWVSYKAGASYVPAESYVSAQDALGVTEINVWIYNTLHEYTVNLYGAKSLSEMSAEREVTLNGVTKNIRVASATLASSDNKLTGGKVYYNQRLGEELGSSSVDTSGYINQYNIAGYNSDIEPINYITRNTLTDTSGSTPKNYRFAYWAYDPAGQVVASTNAYFYYRITNDVDLYAVYAEEDITPEQMGLSIYNNRNDIYVDSTSSDTSGTSRTRMNIVLNPYGREDSDPRIKQTALVYVNLSDKVAGFTNADIISLFNKYRDQLDDILNSNPNVNSFTSTNTITDLTLTGSAVTEVQLTTKGFVRNASSTGGVPGSVTLVTPTAKNRIQYTLSVKSSALRDSKLMFVGAMYYNGNYEAGQNHWRISDNCLYYVDGTAQSLDFGLSTP